MAVSGLRLKKTLPLAQPASVFSLWEFSEWQDFIKQGLDRQWGSFTTEVFPNAGSDSDVAAKTSTDVRGL